MSVGTVILYGSRGSIENLYATLFNNAWTVQGVFLGMPLGQTANTARSAVDSLAASLGDMLTQDEVLWMQWVTELERGMPQHEAKKSFAGFCLRQEQQCDKT